MVRLFIVELCFFPFPDGPFRPFFFDTSVSSVSDNVRPCTVGPTHYPMHSELCPTANAS